MEKDASGVVLEWLKRHAWKACIRQKRIGGSNPPHSAKQMKGDENPEGSLSLSAFEAKRRKNSPHSAKNQGKATVT